MKVQITWTQQELCHVHNILLSERECAGALRGRNGGQFKVKKLIWY